MLVKHAKEIAHDWVENVASQFDEFSGAFIFGSVNWMDDNDMFPHASDIDVRIVLDTNELPVGFKKVSYDKVLLDMSYVQLQQIKAVEDVLCDYATAAHFTRSCILSDPYHHLKRIKVGIEQEFAKHKWVQARVEAVEKWQLDSLKQFLNKSDPFHDQVFAWIYATSMFAHMILVADLKNPTVRKCFVASRDVLNDYNQLAFHDELLGLIGSTDLSGEQVQSLLENCIEVFDTAKQVCKTEFFGSSTISDAGYPTAIGGIDELIQSGYHCEAVFWLVVIHTWCQKILYNDASAETKARFMPRYQDLLATLGISSFEKIYHRIEQVKLLREQAIAITQHIMNHNSHIID